MRARKFRIILFTLAMGAATLGCNERGLYDECEKEGATRCNGNILEICQEEFYITKEDCESRICTVVDEENAYCAAGLCEDGQYSCEGAQLRVCKQGAWENHTLCQDATPICDAAAQRCVARNCEEGSFLCEGQSLKRCTDNAWEVLRECGADEICVDGDVGSCKERICEENVKRCFNNSIQTCINNAWDVESAETCTDRMCDEKSATCVDIVCNDGDTRCSGNTLEVCEKNSFVTKTDCAADICVDIDAKNAECKSKICDEGKYSCEGQQLRICEKNAWKNLDLCADPTPVCDEVAKSCVARVCEESAYQCTGSQLRVCENNSWTDKELCADPTPVCDAVAKSCVERICEDGAYQCTGSQLQVCENNSWTDKTLCEGDTPVCDAAAQKCVLCINGSERCIPGADVFDPQFGAVGTPGEGSNFDSQYARIEVCRNQQWSPVSTLCETYYCDGEKLGCSAVEQASVEVYSVDNGIQVRSTGMVLVSGEALPFMFVPTNYKVELVCSESLTVPVRDWVRVADAKYDLLYFSNVDPERFLDAANLNKIPFVAEIPDSDKTQFCIFRYSSDRGNTWTYVGQNDAGTGVTGDTVFSNSDSVIVVQASLCANNSDCTIANMSICKDGRCQGCGSDADCAVFSDTKVCDRRGVCIKGTECAENADCSGTTPICDKALNQCVPCRQHTDCFSNSGESVCDFSGACKPYDTTCNTDKDCVKDEFPLCDHNRCVTCSNPDKRCMDRNPEKPLCNSATGACESCTDGEHYCLAPAWTLHVDALCTAGTLSLSPCPKGACEITSQICTGGNRVELASTVSYDKTTHVMRGRMMDYVANMVSVPDSTRKAEAVCTTDLSKALSEWSVAGVGEFTGVSGGMLAGRPWYYEFSAQISESTEKRYCLMRFSVDGGTTWGYAAQTNYSPGDLGRVYPGTTVITNESDVCVIDI